MRYFNPRPPCGGRLDYIILKMPQTKISIRALLAEGDYFSVCARTSISISIRALLAEGDDDDGLPVTDLTLISIRALLAEGDLLRERLRAGGKVFQSAPSLRRATLRRAC